MKLVLGLGGWPKTPGPHALRLPTLGRLPEATVSAPAPDAESLARQSGHVP